MDPIITEIEEVVQNASLIDGFVIGSGGGGSKRVSAVLFYFVISSGANGKWINL